MKFIVSGGAGFIGSTFCDEALRQGHEVWAIDNLETGSELFLENAKKHSKFKLVIADIREVQKLKEHFINFKPDWCIHFAANADVRRGLERPTRDLEYNTQGTANILEACRASVCKNILFSSTGSVYGEHKIFPTPEDASFPEQTSLYGASKLAGEALISAYCHGYGMNGMVFRFVSILGPRYTHGHVFDFLKKLKNDPTQMEVLGDGKQTKSYLHIDDLMKGLFLVINKGFKTNVFNIGHEETLIVDESVSYICSEVGVKPKIIHTGGVRGWIGDSPLIHLDASKLKALGWRTTKSLKDSVIDTVRYLKANEFLLERE